MYKWHVNSAFGRGRPLTNDIVRVADGIAASLRQFSVSISRAEDEDSKPSRAQRGAEAAKDILSSPRGIDARALAAKPPQGFTIRRVDESGPRPGGSTYRGSGGFSRGGGTGGEGFVSRGGRTGMRGGGGARGGGRGAARGGRGRGRGARGPRSRQKREDEGDDEIEPLTEEELTWMAGNDGGWPTPYVPKTSLEQLLGKGATVISSPRGLVETAVYKMQVATDNINGLHRHADDHAARMKGGHGTVFESVEAKAVTQRHLGKAKEIPMLPAEERSKLAKTWIAGHYVPPTPAEKKDVLGQVDTYTARNETYLPEDSRKLKAKLATLLPSVTPPRETVRKSN